MTKRSAAVMSIPPPPGCECGGGYLRPPRPLVLLVESDPEVAAFTRNVLWRHGFEVVLASDGAEAVDRWAAEAPDLVLLEINLEGRDGFHVCAEIRRQSNTPVIMLTTRRDAEDVLRGLAVGAADYITKPFSPLQLVSSITVALRKRE